MLLLLVARKAHFLQMEFGLRVLTEEEEGLMLKAGDLLTWPGGEGEREKREKS